jgi:prophage regulatory protein
MQSLETLLNTPLEGRLVRAREISYRLGVSVPTLYHWEKTTDFPKRIRIGANSVAWKGSEIQSWIDRLSNGNDE